MFFSSRLGAAEPNFISLGEGIKGGSDSYKRVRRRECSFRKATLHRAKRWCLLGIVNGHVVMSHRLSGQSQTESRSEKDVGILRTGIQVVGKSMLVANEEDF